MSLISCSRIILLESLITMLCHVSKLRRSYILKWHNSFDHNTSNCNVFRRVIQSAIDKGRLRFSRAQQMDQLDSNGLGGKQVSNRFALAESLKAQGSNAQESDVGP